MGLTGAVARGHLAFACLVAGKTLQQNGQLSEEEPHLGGLLPNSNTIFGQHLIVGDAAGV